MHFDLDRFGTVHLDYRFLDTYRDRPVRWGFGPLSWVTYRRTYSRDGEAWWQTCRRVIEGMVTIQRLHCLQNRLPWDQARADHFAQDAYHRLWSFKWTPPGRGLWIMGTPFMYERGGAALNNCGFVSTRDIATDFPAPFLWVLRMSLLGAGVGVDTRGRGRLTLSPPVRTPDTHTIADSREGWADALARLLAAYVGKASLPADWDYSAVRPRGTPLRSFGGYASGPAPLRDMLQTLTALYDAHVGRPVDAELIVDTMNVIGRCVVAGGIRRSAQIAFGDPDDTRFLDLKLDPGKLSEYRWVSNNSIFASVGMDYREPVRRTAVNGEPGYFWLENARAFGRMQDPPSHADDPALGSNPCVEQTLWDRELCCLVETYPAHHDSFDDYCATLRVAYQYAKTVTLVPVQDPRTRDVMTRNRRIGCSMSGIVQALGRPDRFFDWCDRAYQYIQHLDAEYSAWLDVPRSIKTTSVKPSGTVSILAGATPGVHWEHAPYYIRRVRVTRDHPLVRMCTDAGYPVEPDRVADNASVISFPVHIPNLAESKSRVPLQRKVDLAARMQYHWSDNQVSCTADFDPRTERDLLPQLLAQYERRLKAIVFLPAADHGYAQPPYEEITPERYRTMLAAIKPLRGELPHEQELEARFCEGGLCDIDTQNP